MKDLPTSDLHSRLKFLSEEKCQAIYEGALTIIEDIGMLVPHTAARALLVGGRGRGQGAYPTPAGRAGAEDRAVQHLRLRP
jgi:hypothetical protein